MEIPIRILSTKRLPEEKKLQMVSVGFWVSDEDFIATQHKEFSIKKLDDYLIFTSQNAVESVLRNKEIAQIKAKKCFCVGTKTKKLLEQNGFDVLVYSEYAAELASLICNQYSKNSFTFFCGNLRRDILPEALQLAQITLDEVEVYETILTPHKLDFIPQGVLFFSPSGVESYRQKNKIKDEICFCIGNTTAEALQQITPNIIIANQPTLESVLIKCIEYYKN